MVTRVGRINFGKLRLQFTVKGDQFFTQISYCTLFDNTQAKKSVNSSFRF